MSYQLGRCGLIAARRRGTIFSIRFNSTSTILPPLIGTAPQYTRHLILYTQHTVETWPSHIESVSPLLKALSALKMTKLGITMAEDPKSIGTSWNLDTTLAVNPATPSTIEEESYSGFLCPDFIPIPSISLSTLAEFEAFLLSLPPPPASSVSNSTPSPLSPHQAHIYICAHGSRDCRCRDIGGPLYDELRKQMRKKGIKEELKIFRIAHVGGHMWAANSLVYKNNDRGSDWYGQLRATDAPELIATALSTTSEPLMDHWRGRIGLTAPEVRSIYSDSKLKSVEDSTSIKQKKKKSKLKTALGDPVELTFMTYDEEEIKVVGYEGETLMEVGVRNDFETIQAQCGGHCECATCHVHVILPEPGSSLESSLSLPPISEEEDDQLEFAMGRRDDSRLSCQIVVTKQLGQYIIELPQY